MSEQIQLTINQRQSPNSDKGYSMHCKENLAPWHTVNFTNYNCTYSVERKGILQGLSPFGMGQSFWWEEKIWIPGTINTTLRGKEFFAHNAALLSYRIWSQPGHHFSLESWPDLPSKRWEETWWQNLSSYHQPGHACVRRGKIWKQILLLKPVGKQTNTNFPL